MEGADPLGEETGSAASPRCHRGQQIGGLNSGVAPQDSNRSKMGKTQPWWEATFTCINALSAEIISWLLSTGRTHSYY